MFTVSVETYFWASHQLVLPDGSMVRQAHHPCLPAGKAERSRRKEPLHNHNWSVTADVSSEKLDSMAVVMDFQKLKEMVDNIVAEFDNTTLNEISYFQQNNPSAENVAKFIYEKLGPKLPKGVKLQSIRVVEEPGCSAKYETTNDTDSSGLTRTNL